MTDEAPAAAAAKEEAPKEKAPEGAPVALEDAVSAAEGTRSASKWIASSLGAIPGLTVIAAIVRAPGDAGFDPLLLAFGVFLAGLGALFGILAFAYVLAPASTEESEVENVETRRIPGHKYGSYAELSEWIGEEWTSKGNADSEVAGAEEEAAAAEARLAGGEAELAAAKTALAAAPKDSKLKEAVEAAELRCTELRATCTEKQAELAKLKARSGHHGQQLARGEGIRAQLYRLTAADEIRRRYKNAAKVSVIAVMFVAGGLVCLGLAPEEKKEDKKEAKAAEPIALIVLKPNEAGAKTLDCKDETVRAIKVGGDAETPKIVTLPSATCPTSKEVDFPLAEPEPLGEEAP